MVCGFFERRPARAWPGGGGGGRCLLYKKDSQKIKNKNKL